MIILLLWIIIYGFLGNWIKKALRSAQPLEIRLRWLIQCFGRYCCSLQLAERFCWWRISTWLMLHESRAPIENIPLTLIRESEKKSKTQDRDRACIPKKNPERSIESICICFHALDFFSGKHARSRSQKMAYIFVQHGIFPLILAYAIWN